MRTRHIPRLALAMVRRFGYRNTIRPARYAHAECMLERAHAAEQRRKHGTRIWWPKAAGVSCCSKHGFSREPIAQREGCLFHRRQRRRAPMVPFQRSRLDYDLPF